MGRKGARNKRSTVLKINARRITYTKRGGKVFIHHTLTVPPFIAEQIPSSMRFTAELTEDGILYRPVKARQPPVKPAWLGNNPNPARSPS